ncbi:pantetheine-phosphate adenylyltransferase [Elstera litoralis]
MSATTVPQMGGEKPGAVVLRAAVYPGTFDPVTSGHIDIIRRAARICDRLIVGVAKNAGKGPLFSLDERVALLSAEVLLLPECDRITVVPFEGLLINFAVEHGAAQIVRGLRAVSDFEYEFQMAGMNSKLNPAIETVFLMAADGQQFVSSRFVKEIGKLGGDISRFVSPRIEAALQQRFAEQEED